MKQMFNEECEDYEKVETQQLDKISEKELMKSLIENENEKVKFQNTKNNVAVSNSQRANSKMCFLM
jgi:hypothetical protein